MSRREVDDIPLFWQDQAPPDLKEAITRRRHRYVVNAWSLEEQGFAPATQVTLRSGWLLEKGEDDLIFMVRGRRRDRAERMVREAMGYEKELEFRCASGAVVPLVAPSEMKGSQDFRATRDGFTIYVREVPKVATTPFAAYVGEPLPARIPQVSQQTEHVFVLR